MKQYVLTTIYGSIVSSIFMALFIVLNLFDINLWIANFFLGCFSSSIVVVVFAVISYCVEKRKMVSSLKSFIFYFENNYEILYTYKKKYKPAQITTIVGYISDWHKSITEKFNKDCLNFFCFNRKLNKQVNLLEYKLSQMYIWLALFMERKEDVSIYAWFLFLEERIKILDNIKEIKNILKIDFDKKLNKEKLEIINHFKEQIKSNTNQILTISDKIEEMDNK